MAEDLFGQFDDDFARLMGANDENILHWNNLNDEVSKTVDDLLNETFFIGTVRELDVANSDMSENFPDIKDQVEYKLTKNSQILESKLFAYVSIFDLQRKKIAFLCSECSRSASAFPLSVRGEPSKVLLNDNVEVSEEVNNIYLKTKKMIPPMLVKRAEQLQNSKCLKRQYLDILNSLLGWLEGTETEIMVWNLGERLSH